MHIRPAQIFCADLSPVAAFTKRRTAQEDRALLAHDDRLIDIAGT
jgi:hypothetical protein